MKTVNAHKHLGLMLDSKLTFAHHINEKISNARKGLGIIKLLSRFMSIKDLDLIYKMYVRPHLDFCDVIYHKPVIANPFDSSINLNYLMNTLERIQYHAALAITGAWKGTNLNKIYEELGWESLTDRRWSRRLFHFYKIYNNLTPPYLKDPIPLVRTHLFGTRSENILNTIKCHTDRYCNSFYPNSIISWNNIGPELRNSPNLLSFKKRILALIRPSPKSIFNIYNPLAIKKLYQLRVGLSPLYDHKIKHNFKDIPSARCIVCNQIENCEHFFLHCPCFNDARHTFLNSLSIIYPNFINLQHKDQVFIFLYGDTSLSFAINKSLIEATLKFVTDSERFI